MHASIAGARGSSCPGLLLAARDAAADMAPDDGQAAIHVEPRFEGLEKFPDRVLLLAPIACQKRQAPPHPAGCLLSALRGAFALRRR